MAPEPAPLASSFAFGSAAQRALASRVDGEVETGNLVPARNAGPSATHPLARVSSCSGASIQSTLARESAAASPGGTRRAPLSPSKSSRKPSMAVAKTGSAAGDRAHRHAAGIDLAIRQDDRVGIGEQLLYLGYRR